MRIKSTLIVFLFCFNTFLLQAQTTQSNTYANFYSPDGTSYSCGGKTIIGQIYEYNSLKDSNPRIIFEEDNKFYLEIANENSNTYTKILAQKADISNSGKAQFQLPDSLKVGRTYLLRMSSTSPALISNSPFKLKYGFGLLPFIVNFQQEVTSSKESPLVNLLVTLKLKNKNDTLVNYLDRVIITNLKLTDGSVYTFNPYNLPYSSYISVLKKDSIQIFKIEEVVNSCGVKGEVSGEAKVIQKDYVDKIIIKPTNGISQICKGAKLTIDVNSKSFTTKSTLKVEFSNDYNFLQNSIKSVNATLDKDSRVSVEVPSTLKENEYIYYRVSSEQPNLLSNVQSLYIAQKSDLVNTYLYQNNTNELTIGFDPYLSATNTYAFSNFTEIIVNGVDLVKNGMVVSNTWNLPFPKKDTVLNFTKISNTCGNLKIMTPTLTIKPNEYVYVTFKSKADGLCQGKTVEYSYDLSNPAQAANVKFSVYIQATGKEFSPTSGLFDGQFYGVNTSELKYSINQDKKTLTVSIPSDLDQIIAKQIGNRRVSIESVYLYVYAYNTTSGVKLNYNNVNVSIKLIPKLSLTSSKYELNGVGYINIPIKFTGGNDISYTLSNGQKGVIDHTRLNCSSCQPINGGEQTVRVFVDKTTTFRITSAENECALASVSGETIITVNSDNPSLTIDESKTPAKICRGTNLSLYFLQNGKWGSNPKLMGFVKTYNYDGGNEIKQFEIVSSPFTFASTSDTYFKKMEVWVEAVGTNIKTEVKTIDLESKPKDLNLSTNTNGRVYQDNIEYIYLSNTNSSNYLSFYGFGGNLEFKINGKSLKNTYISNDYSEYSKYITFDNDTTITFNGSSNSCGTLEINRTIKLSKVNTVVTCSDQTYQSFLSTSGCVGTKRIIAYNYYGIIPKKDSLIVQLAKFNNNIDPYNLKYFDIPTLQGKSELTITIPDTCAGSYTFRVRSVIGTHISNYGGAIYSVRQKPMVKITAQSGKTEVMGVPDATLFLNSNYDKSLDFNRTSYSSYDFGLYFNYIYDKNNNFDRRELKNYGKSVSPKQTTTYSIKSVYNQCGIGTAEGNVKIIVQPSITNKISNSDLSNTFCSGDSITVDLSYLGEFPKDTLMGIYLHSYVKASVNQELSTFKNNPTKIKLKLPQDISSGYYFIQTRKKSRSKIFFSGPRSNPDSIARVNAKLNLDSDNFSLNIITPLNISLSGSTEIFVGESAKLITNLLTRNGEDPVVAKDTISFIDGIPFYYDFSDGSRYSSTSKNIIVSPLKSATYSITSIKNACGVGKSTGSATITVFPKSDKRIESIGYLRSYDYERPNIYYVTDVSLCGGSKDSLDIRVYGLGNTTDFSKYKVLLSNKDGVNYTPIKTTKTLLVKDTTTYKIVRLWHELPDNLVNGNNYRIKGVSDDESILSTPLSNPIDIHELATATLTGNASIAMGEKVSAIIKLTGDAPWIMSVVDKDNKFVYNTMPTKKDSTEEYKNFDPKLIYDKEFKLELSPEKSNTYRVTKVFNSCGYGKVGQGAFSVDLVLSKESSSRNLIQIYPNPTVNQIIIDLTSLNETTNIEVLDMNGRLITNKTFDKYQTQDKLNWDFSQHPTGVYFLKIRSNKFLQTYRVVKF